MVIDKQLSHPVRTSAHLSRASYMTHYIGELDLEYAPARSDRQSLLYAIMFRLESCLKHNVPN